MTRNQIYIVAGLVILNVIVFCGGALYAVSALGILAKQEGTAVARATAPITPKPTTAFISSLPTLIPTPTRTQVLQPSAWTPSPAIATIQSAMTMTEKATAYRLEMDMSMKGNLVELTGVSDANQEMSMLGMRGEVSGKDSHLLLTGLVGVLFTGDPAKSMESIEVDGKSYIHGPLPLLGAKDDRWYVLPAQRASSASPVQPTDMFSAMSSGASDFGAFIPIGLEPLDGKQCQVYGANRDAALKSFLSFSRTAPVDQSELSIFQTGLTDAEYRIWICDDGYFHQMRMSFEAQDQAHPDQTVGIKLLLHLYDFDTNIKIAAPPKALPATIPFVTTPTPKSK